MKTDILTEEQRKRAMQSVKSKDTYIEVALRKALWNKGYRYRKNYGKITGNPDIVFVSKKIAIFCDSDFWHGYDWDNRKFDFKSSREFWWPKIERNIERDKEVNDILRKSGWTVLRFWGHEIRKSLEDCLNIVEKVYKNKKS